MRKFMTQRGQSILEYLLIVVFVIAAIIGIQTLVRDRTNDLMTSAGGKISDSKTVLDNMVIDAR